MPDPQEVEVAEVVAEAPASVEVAEPKKRTPRPKKARTAPRQRIAKEGAKSTPKSEDALSTPARSRRKIYSEKERAQILSKIEKSIGSGASVRGAVTETGISEQTYYQWKKTAETEAPAAGFNDLLALEEENKRLKQQLAEHLRRENAELRKRLGLK